MLAMTKGEGGPVAVFLQQQISDRKPPFLRRNVKRSLWCLKMGSTFSILKEAAVGTRQREELLVSEKEDEGEETRPAKRRKIAPFDEDDCHRTGEGLNSGFRDPQDHVTNESSRSLRLPSKPPFGPPSDFYGQPRPSAASVPELRRSESFTNPRRNFIDSVKTQNTRDLQKALRVDLLGVFSNEENFLDSPRNDNNSVDIKCKCSAAVFYSRDDEDPGSQVRREYTELCRTIKTGVLRVMVGQDGEITRELIFEPFIFTSEELFVTRRKSHHYFHEFADSYNIQVTLEPHGFQEDWPALDILSFPGQEALDGRLEPNAVSTVLNDGRATENDLHLYCKTLLLVDPTRQCKAVNLSICYRTLKQPIPYVLKLQIRWAVQNTTSALPTPPKFESPRRPKSEAIPMSPLAPKPADISAPNSPADSRPQRRKGTVETYNLKALSAQAQGKSPRKRRPRDMRSKSDQRLSADELSITYCFGRADSAEHGIKQQYMFTGLRCPFCGCGHNSLDELRFHLHGEHHNFKFHLRRPKPPRIQYFVEVVKILSNPFVAQRTFQMSRPGTLFDLEKYLNGDNSWAKAREGPIHNHWPDHLTDRGQESSLSSSPRGSRYSSPNTSNSMDDFMDFEPHEPKLSAFEPRKVFRVPRTNKPLYDTVTKRVLEPGEEIPSSDDEKDESWFHQKHRDIINDFEDITAEEKDYIIQWNPFIVHKHLTSEKYLPEAICQFVESNKGWFAQRATRKTQFLKQMETFILRGVVSEDCLHKCLGILRREEARKGKEDVNMDAEDEEREVSPTKHRGLLDCTCCEHTQPRDRVVCSGLKCKGRYFHRECAKEFGRPIVGKWICDSCLSP